MSLDKNLFTLKLEPSKSSPNAVDLVEPSGVVHYRKTWVPNDKEAYCFSVHDPLSESVLATVTAPSATSKQKLIELHNPSVSIPLNYTGLLQVSNIMTLDSFLILIIYSTFKWTFVWEGNQFDWKREECYMNRKPDPPVLVAVTKEPPGKLKTSTVQILDYNINRFDIQDRKGLEIAILTSLLTFSDYSEQLKIKPSGTSPIPQPPAAQPLSRPQPPIPSSSSSPPPPPPPKPIGWDEDQIAILQAKEQRDINEVVIGDVGTLDDYVKHCVSLLGDETLLYITLRSQDTKNVSKVVQVAEATKRLWYKTSGYDEELHQYIDTSFNNTEPGSKKGKGPRVINLDDPPLASTSSAQQPITSYEPPSSLTIHLSKISMPELEPVGSRGRKTPRIVRREPSPERKHEKHKHTKGHKHHASELTPGSQRITNHDTKGKSHHHSHASQDLALVRSSSLSPNSYTVKLSSSYPADVKVAPSKSKHSRPLPTSEHSSSSPSSSSQHRPNLKISSSSTLKPSKTQSRPLPTSPASSSSMSTPSPLAISPSPVVQYTTTYPQSSASPSHQTLPSRGSFWKRW